MSRTRLSAAAVFAALIAPASLSSASAHSISGDRLFPATLAIDDPGVADELALPTVTYLPGGAETDYSFEFAKRITPDFAVSVGDTYIHSGGVSGFDNLGVGFKYLGLVDAKHEFMTSLGLDIDVGGTGSSTIGAEPFWTFTPGMDFGKGFGDLPDNANLLRPFAVTGQIGYAVPSRARTEGEQNPSVLNWGFTVQYSLPYMNANVQEVGGPAFLKQLVPIVEASFETPVANLGPGDGRTTGTIQPGLVYMAQSYQFAVEAVIPVNRASGRRIGVTAELHFFLDDIFANSLGKPLFQ